MGKNKMVSSYGLYKYVALLAFERLSLTTKGPDSEQFTKAQRKQLVEAIDIMTSESVLAILGKEAKTGELTEQNVEFLKNTETVRNALVKTTKEMIEAKAIKSRNEGF